jgi:hypothetical protein
VGAYFGGVEGFYPAPSSHLFAAVIALDSGKDFPDSKNFTTPDCLAVGTFETGARPGDAIAPMDLIAGPGWYLAAIGSNAFGVDFQGSEAAHLPTELEDNAPGQLMIAIGAGHEGFLSNAGAPRFVVRGETLSPTEKSSPISSRRLTNGCS